MASSQKSLKTVLELAASGAVGVALLLGATPQASAAAGPSETTGEVARNGQVSERLAAIREAVSEVARGEPEARGNGLRLAWHNWGNHWNHPWGNWGWGWETPWGNYGYGVPWNNWNNWRNGWNNWRNRWGNR